MNSNRVSERTDADRPVSQSSESVDRHRPTMKRLPHGEQLSATALTRSTNHPLDTLGKYLWQWDFEFALTGPVANCLTGSVVPRAGEQPVTPPRCSGCTSIRMPHDARPRPLCDVITHDVNELRSWNLFFFSNRNLFKSSIYKL